MHKYTSHVAKGTSHVDYDQTKTKPRRSSEFEIEYSLTQWRELKVQSWDKVDNARCKWYKTRWEFIGWFVHILEWRTMYIEQAISHIDIWSMHVEGDTMHVVQGDVI